MITPLEALEEDYRRRHGGMSAAEEQTLGPCGLDMVSAESAEPWPEATVLCVSGRHDVKLGTDCPHCTGEPDCSGCPGKPGPG